MGRLAKAFALDRESSRLMPFDEQEFLREAGQIAARLRSELDGSSEVPKMRVVQNDVSQTLAELQLAFQAGDVLDARDAISKLRREQGNTPSSPNADQRHEAESSALRTRQWDQSAAEFDRREAEVSHREAALAHSVQAALVELKLRSEHELRERSKVLEADWTERHSALARERDEWAAQHDRQQAELHELRQATERDIATSQTLIEEQTALRLKVEAQVRDVETAQQETVEKVRQNVAVIVESERAKLETQRAELERLTREQTEFGWQRRRELEVDLNQLRTEWLGEHEIARRQAEHEVSALRATAEHDQRELHAAIEQWHSQRADEAVLLREERQQIDAARQDVEAAATALASERQLLVSERQELLNERDRQRAEIEREKSEHRTAIESEISQQRDALQQRIADFEASLSQRDEALADRERLFAQKSAQQDSDWTARCRAVEHDLRLQAELIQQRLAEERAYFEAQCVRRETALTDELAADRADIVRQRRQLEEERNQVRHSLQQMDRQVRLLANNIESPSSQAVIEQVEDRLPFVSSIATLRLDDGTQTVPAPHLLPEIARSVETVQVVANDAMDNDAEASATRRKALEQYRQMLGELQAQVHELAAVAKSGSVSPDDELTGRINVPEVVIQSERRSH